MGSGSAKQNSNQLRVWRNWWKRDAERGWAAEAGAVLSGVFADRESKKWETGSQALTTGLPAGGNSAWFRRQ
jgi:hypothetical protein